MSSAAPAGHLQVVDHICQKGLLQCSLADPLQVMLLTMIATAEGLQPCNGHCGDAAVQTAELKRAYLMTLTVMAPRLLASKAFLRAHISYRTHPMAHTSVLPSYALPCTHVRPTCKGNACTLFTHHLHACDIALTDNAEQLPIHTMPLHKEPLAASLTSVGKSSVLLSIFDTQLVLQQITSSVKDTAIAAATAPIASICIILLMYARPAAKSRHSR